MTAFFLEAELPLLQNQDWYCDGTFTLMKDLDEQQVYIIARLFENEDGTRVFTYPIAFFFLKKKLIGTYKKIFQILDDHYFEIEGEHLRPSALKSDCEQSFITAGKKFFPDVNIELCEVHILRSWEKNFKFHLGHHNVRDNPILKKFSRF